MGNSFSVNEYDQAFYQVLSNIEAQFTKEYDEEIGRLKQ